MDILTEVDLEKAIADAQRNGLHVRRIVVPRFELYGIPVEVGDVKHVKLDLGLSVDHDRYPLEKEPNALMELWKKIKPVKKGRVYRPSKDPGRIMDGKEFEQFD